MTDPTLIDYLTQIDSPPGLFLWLCMLIAFLVGFLIAYLLRSGKVRRLKRELKEVRQEAETNHTLLVSAQEQLKQRNAELQEESREKVALMEKVRLHDDEHQRQLHEVVVLNEKLEAMQADYRAQQHTVDDLNGQLLTFHNNPDQIPDNASTTVFVQSDNDQTTEEVSALRDRLNAFEQALERLEQENDTLKTDLEEIKNQPAGTVTVLNDAQDIQEDKPDSEDPTLIIHADKTALYDKIIVADREKDDLTKIEGLGEFLEKKLNGLGIFSYDQIASWTSSHVDQVTQQIGYIPGRIEKDDWVGQAARLLQAEQDEVATSEYDARPEEAEEPSVPTDEYARGEMDPDDSYVAEVEAEAPVSEPENTTKRKGYKPDNLKMVEGIGPKIESVLKEAGINDLATLGSANPGRLREILEEAGDQYRMHNPYTWPLQARLAASGRWEEFDQYQAELKGGK